MAQKPKIDRTFFKTRRPAELNSFNVLMFI